MQKDFNQQSLSLQLGTAWKKWQACEMTSKIEHHSYQFLQIEQRRSIIYYPKKVATITRG